MKKLILRNFLSPGDVLMLTAAVRDLHLCHPGEFVTDVRTPHKHIWKYNPYLTSLNEADSNVESIDCHYPLIHHSNQRPVHFISGFTAFLNERLGTHIESTAFKGDVHLSEKERCRRSLVYKLLGEDRPYWIIASGGKYDFTNKWWDSDRYQEVVNHFQGKIFFVQIGRGDHHHPPLTGVLNLVGRTNLRQLIRLVHHSEGIVCPVTLLMHLAAAVPAKQGNPEARPCVVIAGGREPVQWEAYPNHQFIHTIGALPCCLTGGCWKSRVLPLGDGDEKDRPEHLCTNVVGKLPKCMDMITSDEVVRRIDLYFNGGVCGTRGNAAPKVNSVACIPEWTELYKDYKLNQANALSISLEVIRNIPTYSGGYAGKGIIICGGGIEYFTNAWVCINMLRRLRSRLPIQLWHLGPSEVDGAMRRMVEKLDVECVDAIKISEQYPCRILSGWELKAYSILYSPFEEILLLDADNVPLAFPECLFEWTEYRKTGAVFWPDYHHLKQRSEIWAICGAPFRRGPQFETGQILVNKAKCWRALHLALWYNAFSDFYYQYIHGDKDTFHMAFLKLNQRYAMPSRRIESLDGTMCQHDFFGNRIFQHRNTDKWCFETDNKCVSGFLFEDECRSFVHLLRKEWSGNIDSS